MTSPLPARRDPSTPEALRHGLDALSAIDPPYDVAAGAARFEATLSGAPTPVAAARGTGVAKLLVIVAVVVLGAAVLGWVGRAGDAPDKTVAVVEVTATPEVEPDADGGAATPTVVPSPDPVAPRSRPDPAPAESKEPLLESSPPQKVVRRKQKAAPEEERSDDPLMREMKLLNATRKHVTAHRSTDALATIAEAREIPTRRFDEEWQALEILALAGAGKVERARALAKPYLARHEGGRFNASIERALGTP